MKEGKYTKALAKIQVCAIFHARETFENFFTYIYRALYGDAMLLPIRMVTNIAAGNQQKHVSRSCTTLYYLRVNSSLEELINIDIDTMTIQIAKFPPTESLFQPSWQHSRPLIVCMPYPRSI